MRHWMTSLSLLALPLQAHGIDWQFRSGVHMAAEGGLLTGSKVPLLSNSQKDYDDETARSGPGEAAVSRIKTLKLRGPEGFANGTMAFGYEGFSNDMQWQSAMDVKASAGLGNSTGRFFNPPFDPIYPTQGRAGRDSGWLAGGEARVHWLPLPSFTGFVRASFGTGSHKFSQSFSRLRVDSEFELKAHRFLISPGFAWQRLLGSDALPAADVSAWSLDIEWLGTRYFRIQNARGYPLVKVWRSTALGSPLLVTALENEGHFLEFNVTPKVLIGGGLSVASHVRSVSGSDQSYIAPSLATELKNRGQQQNNWEPPAASADYTSHTIEWRNSLVQKITSDWSIYGGLLYTNQANAFAQTATSNLRYSDLIDSARESTFRYFLGSEFLL